MKSSATMKLLEFVYFPWWIRLSTVSLNNIFNKLVEGFSYELPGMCRNVTNDGTYNYESIYDRKNAITGFNRFSPEE